MKLKEFQHYLKEQGIDLALLIHPDINITYFTQIKPSFAILTLTPNSANLHLTSLDERPKLKHITIKRIQKGWEKKLTKNKVKKIGLNKEIVSVAFWEKIRKTFPQAKLVDVSTKLNELRAQKTSEELKLIKRACQVTTLAFNELISQLKHKKLKTEHEAACFLEEIMKEHHCTPAFPTITAMGKNASIPHYKTSTQKLSRGFLLLDFGASYKNYNADMSRTIFLGTPNKKERELYELLLQSQLKVITQIKENIHFSELQSFTRKQLGRYSSHFIHLLGHGVGLEVHEPPSFSLEAKQKVQKGNVFTIEPGIYFHKKLGIRIEDTILFDEKARILTKAPKELLFI